ncbi:ATP-binding protein [Nitrososphaera sp.]|uniref:ATP-binding protein n=1 Tax=Nitrososphaera sp. TaxID=1971748 RepID=UPI00307F7B8D
MSDSSTKEGEESHMQEKGKRAEEGFLREKQQALLVAALVVLSVSLAIFLQAYYSATESRAVNSAREQVERYTKTAAGTLSRLLEVKLESIGNNLATLADSRAAQDGEHERMKMLLMSRQQLTQDLTESYFWLDRDGRVVWGALMVEDPAAARFAGADFSNRDYFLMARDTGQPYYTSVTDSADGIPRIYIAYPIMAPKGGAASPDGGGDGDGGSSTEELEFRGVVAASIKPGALAEFINANLPAGFAGRIGVLDRDGSIIYTDDPSLFGENVFGRRVQSAFNATIFSGSPGQRDAMNSILRDSLAGNSASTTVVISGSDTAYSYHPLYSSNGQLVGTLHVLAPFTFSNDIAQVISSQRAASLTSIVAIGGTATFLAYLILSWNRRLEQRVGERTAELAAKTRQLEKSNEELAATTEDLRDVVEELADKNRELQDANRQLEEYSSQLEEANEQLKKHDRMQKEFINIAAHELRTPIQPILMVSSQYDLSSKNAGEAEDGEEEEEDTDEEMRIKKIEMRLIARNAARLDRLASDILDATRIESGMLRLNREENVDLSRLASEAIEDAKRQAAAAANNASNSNSIRFELDIPKGPPPAVTADSYRIRQVLANLLNNAIKFTQQEGGGGTITVRVERRDTAGEVQVSVSDTGSGIDPEIRPRLFQKFAGKSEVGTSTGLGLYISKAIVEAHGGRMWAENNAHGDGKGTTFAFTLPLRSPAPSSRDTPPADGR